MRTDTSVSKMKTEIKSLKGFTVMYHNCNRCGNSIVQKQNEAASPQKDKVSQSSDTVKQNLIDENWLKLDCRVAITSIDCNLNSNNNKESEPRENENVQAKEETLSVSSKPGKSEKLPYKVKKKIEPTNQKWNKRYKKDSSSSKFHSHAEKKSKMRYNKLKQKSINFFLQKYKKGTDKEHKNISTKKMSSSKQKKTPSNVDKVPTKGTLKRKRWFADRVIKYSQEQNQDFLANQIFCEINAVKVAASDESYSAMSTPEHAPCMSPIPRSVTPEYRDYYDPEELKKMRKDAEEYNYVRNKKRKKLLKLQKDLEKTHTATEN